MADTSTHRRRTPNYPLRITPHTQEFVLDLTHFVGPRPCRACASRRHGPCPTAVSLPPMRSTGSPACACVHPKANPDKVPWGPSSIRYESVRQAVARAAGQVTVIAGHETKTRERASPGSAPADHETKVRSARRFSPFRECHQQAFETASSSSRYLKSRVPCQGSYELHSHHDDSGE